VMAHENGMRTDFDSVRRRYYHNSGTDLLALLVYRASEVLRLRFEECEINEGSGARLEERFNRFTNRFGSLSLVAGARLSARRFRPPRPGHERQTAKAIRSEEHTSELQSRGHLV